MLRKTPLKEKLVKKIAFVFAALAVMAFAMPTAEAGDMHHHHHHYHWHP
jgi:hypothetical protein